jgi:transcription-repair coupling factor (superfamily II helicase)
MKDLEIRGAGTLLGTKQSGSISAVGFNLYTQMLAQAVEDQKASLSGIAKEVKPVRRPEPSIDLPLRAFIPDSYVTDIDTRLSIYQKLTGLTLVEQVNDLTKELNDRFGSLPEEAQNLLYAVKLKTLGAKVGVESVSTNDNIITIRILPGLQFNRQKLIPFCRFGLKIGVSQLIINLKNLRPDWQKILEEIIKSIL